MFRESKDDVYAWTIQYGSYRPHVTTYFLMVAAMSDNTDKDHFHHCRKFCRAACHTCGNAASSGYENLYYIRVCDVLLLTPH